MHSGREPAALQLQREQTPRKISWKDCGVGAGTSAPIVLVQQF